MRIAFTHNLRTSYDEAQAEFDSAETVTELTEFLRGLGHEVHPVDVMGPVSRLVARLETLRPDLVFNTAEGTHGRFREAFYPALFEQLMLPYTGSSAYVCGVTLDKQATKLTVQRAGVKTPRWAFFDADTPRGEGLAALEFPVIVKPNFEGSSKGVTADSVVYSAEQLEAKLADTLIRYASGALVEEFIVGQDVTVPYLEEIGVLSPASYRLDVEGVEEGYEIYDYSLKNDHPERVHVDAPAALPAELTARLMKDTETVMRVLDIRDMGRADYRITPDGRVYFIEVNALPSLEPGASIYECAKLRGLASEGAVLKSIIDSAVRRHRVVARAPRRSDSLTVGLAHNVKRVDPTTEDDRDAEFDSPATIDAIASAIRGLGHEVVLLEAQPELARIIGDVDVDLVFNIAEGLRGRSREAQVPALLELMGIPYTGSDASALALTLDKGLAKRLVGAAGVSTPAWAVVPPGQSAPEGLRFPVIVKPNAEGSSKGIDKRAVARDAGELAAAVSALHARYRASALVEEFLVGREFTVGLLGEHDPTPLPIMQVCFEAAAGELPVYSFSHKTEADLSVRLQVPAEVDDALAVRIREVALASFEALGCRDVGRVDVRLDAAGEPNFIECNPLLGLSPGWSDLCVAAEAVGMDHAALIGAIMAPAVHRLMLERAGGVQR